MSEIFLTAYNGSILGPIAKGLGWIMDRIYVLLAAIGVENIALTIFILSSLSPISSDSECPEGSLEISLFNKQLGDSHETSLAQIHGRPYIFSSVLK